jgi:hypothetical protein
MISLKYIDNPKFLHLLIDTDTLKKSSFCIKKNQYQI